MANDEPGFMTRPLYGSKYLKNGHFAQNLKNESDIFEKVLTGTLSKCPGGHPVLYWGLKLNSKISSGWNIQKIKFTGANCGYFGQNPKRKGIF